MQSSVVLAPSSREAQQKLIAYLHITGTGNIATGLTMMAAPVIMVPLLKKPEEEFVISPTGQWTIIGGAIVCVIGIGCHGLCMLWDHLYKEPEAKTALEKKTDPSLNERKPDPRQRKQKPLVPITHRTVRFKQARHDHHKSQSKLNVFMSAMTASGARLMNTGRQLGADFYHTFSGYFKRNSRESGVDNTDASRLAAATLAPTIAQDQDKGSKKLRKKRKPKSVITIVPLTSSGVQQEQEPATAAADSSTIIHQRLAEQKTVITETAKTEQKDFVPQRSDATPTEEKAIRKEIDPAEYKGLQDQNRRLQEAIQGERLYSANKENFLQSVIVKQAAVIRDLKMNPSSGNLPQYIPLAPASITAVSVFNGQPVVLRPVVAYHSPDFRR